MKKEDLTLFASKYNKFRLGKNNDGGYVLIDVPNIKYNLFLSAGISTDCSFEEHFCDRFNTKCYAFDGTIDNINTHNKNINFIKKNIGINNNEIETNLLQYIDNNNNIFLKLDIEGAEISWLNILTKKHFEKINQMIIEFHFCEPPYFNNFSECNTFNEINKYYNLLHLHANNCCGTKIYDNIEIPKVFECTYVNKKFINELSLNENNLPMNIDQINIIGHNNDIVIDYEPFVNKK